MICPQDEKCPWYGTTWGDHEHDTFECGRVMSSTGRCRARHCKQHGGVCQGTDYPLPDAVEVVEEPTQSVQNQRRGMPLPHDPGYFGDLTTTARIMVVVSLIIIALWLIIGENPNG